MRIISRATGLSVRLLQEASTQRRHSSSSSSSSWSDGTRNEEQPQQKPLLRASGLLLCQQNKLRMRMGRKTVCETRGCQTRHESMLSQKVGPRCKCYRPEEDSSAGMISRLVKRARSQMKSGSIWMCDVHGVDSFLTNQKMRIRTIGSLAKCMAAPTINASLETEEQTTYVDCAVLCGIYWTNKRLVPICQKSEILPTKNKLSTRRLLFSKRKV